MANNLTLFQIDDALLQLLEAREELQQAIATPIICEACRGTGRSSPFSDAVECPACEPERTERKAELAEVERLLAEYAAQLPAKVDRVRGFLLEAETRGEAHRKEAGRQLAMARSWESRAEYVKAIAADVIARVPERKRLQGSTGCLLLKGNGGLQPLVITDESQIPEECCKYVGWVGGELWRQMEEALAISRGRLASWGDMHMTRTVDNDRVRRALPVPGAHLEERGKHVEVK